MVALKLIRKVKAKVEIEWMSRSPKDDDGSQIVAVDLGHKLINGNRTPELAIRVLVTGKTDRAEPRIPTAILVDETYEDETCKIAPFPLIFPFDGSPESLIENRVSLALLERFQEHGYALPDDSQIEQYDPSLEWQVTSRSQSFGIARAADNAALTVVPTGVQEGDVSFELDAKDSKLLRKFGCPDTLKNGFLEHHKISLSERATIEEVADGWIIEDEIQIFGIKLGKNRVSVYPAIRTDVIVRPLQLHPSGSEYVRKAKEIRPGMGLASGSAGAVVRDRNSGQKMLLTCRHSLPEDRDELRLGRQSGPEPLLGRIHARGRQLDCALVEIEGDPELIPEIPGIGQTIGTATGVRGMRVCKYGRETQLTYGTVDTVDLTVHVKSASSEQNEWLRKHIGIVVDLTQSSQFCDGGDSGSVVVNEAQEVIGLLVARSEDGSYGIAAPIQQILEELKVDLHIEERAGLDGIIDDLMSEVASTGNLLQLGPSAIRVLQFLWGCCDCPRSPSGSG